MPYIASKTGALVIGTESTANFARDNGVPNSQILTVKGGEDLELGSCSVRVIPSLHGILRRSPLVAELKISSLPPPSTIFPADAKPPFRFGQLLVEGGTLAYLIRLGGQEVLVFGSMSYVEREVDGLRPDVALHRRNAGTTRNLPLYGAIASRPRLSPPRLAYPLGSLQCPL